MSPEKRREIAKRGGKAAQAKGTGHRWDESEAEAAGRKGGLQMHKNKRRREQEQADGPEPRDE